MINESFISLFTFAAVQNDFSFFDLTQSYSLLYMSKSCSVRVAIIKFWSITEFCLSPRKRYYGDYFTHKGRQDKPPSLCGAANTVGYGSEGAALNSFCLKRLGMSRFFSQNVIVKLPVIAFFWSHVKIGTFVIFFIFEVIEKRASLCDVAWSGESHRIGLLLFFVLSFTHIDVPYDFFHFHFYSILIIYNNFFYHFFIGTYLITYSSARQAEVTMLFSEVFSS